MAVIGIDFGGTNFRIGTVAESGKVTAFRKCPVKDVFVTADPIRDLEEYLRGYLYVPEVKRIKKEAVSIGFPATLDRKRETVLQAPNMPFMENLPVAAALREKLGMPVFLERDVTMILQYDMEKYRIPAEGIVCGIYFGTGIGNAICINGVPLAGRHGTAGELGHIPVDSSNERCGCGNTGCMESLAGGKHLMKLCREVYPETCIDSLFTEHGSDPLLVKYIDRMAAAVATELNILDPDYLLLGGGVLNMANFPREQLLNQIKKHARKPYPAKDLPIIFTKDEENKGVIGASRYARAKLEDVSAGISLC